MSIQRKIFLLILLSVFLPLAGTGGYVFWSQKGRIESELASRLREIGRSTAEQLDTYILQRTQEVAMVGTSSTLRATPESATYGLGRYRRTFTEIDALVFVDPRGNIVATSGTLARTLGDVETGSMVRRWFERAVAGEHIIDAVDAPGDFSRYLVFAAPADHEGQRYGWVFGQVNSERLADIAARVRIGETGRATLFNHRGILIGHPVKERYGYDMSAYPILREPLNEKRGNPGAVFLSGDGRLKWGMTLVLERTLAEHHRLWGIIVDQTLEEMNAPVRELRNAILIASLVGSLFVTLLAFWVNGMLGINRKLRESATALRESEERFEQFASTSNTVFWVRTEAEMLYVSPAFSQIWCANCRSFAERRPHCFLGALHPDDEARVLADFQRAVESHLPFIETYRIVRPDGSVRWVEVEEFVVQGNHVPPRRTGTAEDITDRLESEDKMREALVVFNASSQAIMSTDPAGRIRSVNQAFTDITGYSAAEAIGRTPALLSSGRHDASFYSVLWKALISEGHWEGEIWNRRKNGETYPEWLTITAVRDAAGTVLQYIALFSDISVRKAQEAVVWKQANFDALTGLANRNLLSDRLDRAIAQARRSERKVGLVFMDLDGFKWINDTLGHDFGDRILVEVARRIEQCVRDQDTAARLGGDEFTVVVMDLDGAESLRGVGEKLLVAMRQPFSLAGHDYHLSGSIGVTVFPDDGEDVQTLLKNADIAMYRAKQEGKNRLQFFARQMHEDAQNRLFVESELRAAVAEGGFVLHYQPVVDVASGVLCGAEALVRWPHAERGLVSPLDFIPAAEHSGLISDLGEWVVREAARQVGVWNHDGCRLDRLAVNVSGLQFRDRHLAKIIAGLLREHAIDPGNLLLEITESVLMANDEATESTMQDIRALGVHFALDDFGTGYSSLSYLRRFPVNVVKIDRSFVSDCTSSPGDRRIVEAIVRMAHSLGLQVTAEGVESESQLAFLRGLGCDYAQGFLISQPLPAAEFEARCIQPVAAGRKVRLVG